MTLFQAFGQFAGQAAAAPAAGPGMVLIDPTSIANSGGSATLGANGQVTFSGVSSVSMNGCFSADYENYVLYMNWTSTNDTGVLARMRAAGSDESGTNYTTQVLNVVNTTVASGRDTGQTSGVCFSGTSAPNGGNLFIYRPFIAARTIAQSMIVSSSSTVRIDDRVWSHSLTTSYDGITLIIGTGSMTGKLAIYGYRS